MAAFVSTGSPRMSRRSTPTSNVIHESIDTVITPRGQTKAAGPQNTNFRTSQINDSETSDPNQIEVHVTDSSSPDSADSVSSILARLRINDNRKTSSSGSNEIPNSSSGDLNKIIGHFKNQSKVLKRQEMGLKEASSHYSGKNSELSASSEVYVQPERRSQLTASIHSSNQQNITEIQQIKKELEVAHTIMKRQEMELAQSRNLKHTMEQAIGPASEADFSLHPEGNHNTDGHAHSAFNAAARPFTSSRNNSNWPAMGNSYPDTFPGFSNARITTGRSPFPGPAPAQINEATLASGRLPITRDQQMMTLGCFGMYSEQASPSDSTFPSYRSFPPSSPRGAMGMDDRVYRYPTSGAPFPGISRNNGPTRSSSTMTDPLSPVMIPQNGLSHIGTIGQYGGPDRLFGVQMSPLSPDFVSNGNHSLVSVAGTNSPTFVTPLEPMNYRRLLDKSVSCDWKYIVDKIVCNNDQQASIFLQQKLKVGTAEQKYEIVESIVNQAYPLMINRFGNFLVQRCFEHGTPEQVIAIANSIHGNVISLSMDPFGCHVIQKAFDSVPEDHKADMVRELLRRIPDTVIHRYACHVWQKLFELRWTGEPPQIMLKVNEALEGMWHEVALGETGSLVVQNIFENCVEEEKRPAINEVIAHIDLIAHGQFGNWCIQHLCEHGSPPDKRRVIDHILANSYSYSVDQFASKVVEKCLKIGGAEFLDRYLTVITTARPDRPRIPLIDIAGDQYGNYLVQWILMNTHQHQREQVAIHIRKHMVSLRGSKFGSRVAMLCSNPASVTRPGPLTAVANPYGTPGGQPRTSWARFR